MPGTERSDQLKGILYPWAEQKGRGGLAELLRFGAVGVINTLVGYAVIYACMLGLGISPLASNVAGYAVGLCCSFLLNRRLTFRSEGHATREALRFLLAFAIAYAVNLAVLLASIELLGVPPVWAQLVSGVAYTGVFFLLSKRYVFAAAKPARATGGQAGACRAPVDPVSCRAASAIVGHQVEVEGLNTTSELRRLGITRHLLPHGFKLWPDFAAIRAQSAQLGEEWQGQQAYQRQLLELGNGRLQGFCAACGKQVGFSFRAVGGEVNWRESLHCEGCGLINRWRASEHLFNLLPRPTGPVYVTEQTTSLFAHLARRCEGLIGSEYIAPDCSPGEIRQVHGRDLRHEDLTALSFGEASLAALLSFDVLEHVPDYRAAVREIVRVLAPGGLLLLTAPFSLERHDTVQRARIGADGAIEHLLPPQYHGDPLSDQGVLCFQEFGWDLLDLLREAGLSEAAVVTVWAPHYGYLDTAQPFIVARR